MTVCIDKFIYVANMNFIYNHPYLFSMIAIFLFGVIIMIYEMRRAVNVTDDYEEEYYCKFHLQYFLIAIHRWIYLFHSEMPIETKLFQIFFQRKCLLLFCNK